MTDPGEAQRADKAPAESTPDQQPVETDPNDRPVLQEPLYATPEGTEAPEAPATATFTEAPRIVSEATAQDEAAHEEAREATEGYSADEDDDTTS
jgi:hypothetical protein